MEPINSSRFSSAASFQPLDVFLDVPGHLVEIFRELADFRSAADGGALVKFAAADGARGGRQPANRPADAHGEKISDKNGDQNDDADECSAWRFSSVTPVSFCA